MKDYVQDLYLVHYLPILTTLFSAYFFIDIGGRYKEKGGRHLLWWTIGVFTFGLGTLFESIITLNGNTILLNKAWYVAGAILGGYPLAQGSVYLHLKRKTANILSMITVPFVIFASVCVFLSPVDVEALQIHKPSGNILVWQWVRLLTPFINIYAAIFLIGSAFWSAIKFFRLPDERNRAVGNILITIGALLPGIGGGMAKAGMVEALHVGEFLGIILIYLGYRRCLKEFVPIM